MSGRRFSRALLVRSITGLVIGATVGAALTDAGLMAIAFLFASTAATSPGSLVSLVPAGLGYGAIRGALLVFPVVALICWPIHLGLLRTSWRSAVVYAPIWATVLLLVSLVAPGNPSQAPAGWLFAVPIATGLIAGLIFWAIRRPDRDA